MVAKINADVTNGVVITSDTSGELELQANGVTKAKVTANGLQDANGNSLRGVSFRNLIINGDMQIAQRGASTTGLQYNNDNNYPCCDRWNFHHFGSSSYDASFTGSQDTDVPTGQGFASSLKLACTTADATLEADSAILFRQNIEGQNLQHLKYGNSSAENITLSFWVKSNLTGTFGISAQHGTTSGFYGAEYTIDTADTWEKKTITIAGNTADAIDNDNNVGLRLYFYFALGSNYNGGTNEQWVSNASLDSIAPNMTNNLGGSTSNYINITGVQLEVGEGASDFEFLPYGVQLQRCQRYYYELNGTATNTPFGMCIANSTTQIQSLIPFPVTMRSSPTLSYSSTASNFRARIGGSNHDGTALPNTLLAKPYASYVTQEVATGMTPGDGGVWRTVDATETFIAFSAEL